jgi:hypothetical protein
MLLEQRGDGASIAMLGWILSDCEAFVSFYADDDEDKSAMQEVIAALKAMVAAEAAPDADDEADVEDVARSHGAVEIARARLRMLELDSPMSTPTLRSTGAR